MKRYYGNGREVFVLEVTWKFVYVESRFISPTNSDESPLLPGVWVDKEKFEKAYKR